MPGPSVFAALRRPASVFAPLASGARTREQSSLVPEGGRAEPAAERRPAATFAGLFTATLPRVEAKS